MIDRIVAPDDRLVMVVGNYGSGKTEVSVNLAVQLARAGRRVQIADLDLVILCAQPNDVDSRGKLQFQ